MGTLSRFFRTIFLVDLFKGLFVTLKYTPQPAFTFQYPAERRPVAPRFRGVLRLQVEPGTGAQNCIVCGPGAKAGARALTSTSGPGISLMGEFVGPGHKPEIPAVILDVERVGPSTGLPTRTAQGVMLSTRLL